MLSSNSPRPSAVVSSNSADEKGGGKRKRRPAGTPDPEAEVVSLSPRTLLEAERHVCEICGQGFQREQNLQMHRRRHKVAWKLAKRRPGTEKRSGGGCSGNSSGSTKRVFVCPEANCLHHDPRHALGDLVGMKKHFRRKHSGVRQWACARCGKAYAVQSDYKAHLKTCGTRGHSCDCGRVFSRVESFIEHQDSCHASRAGGTGGTTQPPPAVASSSTAAALSNAAAIPSMGADGGTKLTTNYTAFPSIAGCSPARHQCHGGNLELQLLPLAIAPNHSGKATTTTSSLSRPDSDDDDAYQETTKLQLSIGRGDGGTLSPARESIKRSSGGSDEPQEQLFAAAKARQDAVEQLELAEQEFANAKRIRQQAQAELQNACIFRDQSKRQISLMLLQITCNPCRMKHLLSAASKKSSLETASHASSSVTGISNGEADAICQIKI